MKRIVLILVTVLLGIGLFAQVPKVNQNVYGIRVKNAINRAIDTVNATYVDVSAVVDTNDAQTVILNDHESRVDHLEGDSAEMGVYNVLDWGATGDGVTNDTDSIQACADAAAAAGDYPVYLPPGTYLLDSVTFKDGCDIIGAGTHATFIKANLNKPPLHYYADDGADAYGWEYQNVIEKFSIYGSNSADSSSQDGIVFNGSCHVAMNHVYIYNCGGYAIRLGNLFSTDNIRFYDVYGQVNYLGGVYGRGYSGSQVNAIRFDQCEMSQNYGYGWNLTGNCISLDGCIAQGNDSTAVIISFRGLDASASVNGFYIENMHTENNGGGFLYAETDWDGSYYHAIEDLVIEDSYIRETSTAINSPNQTGAITLNREPGSSEIFYFNDLTIGDGMHWSTPGVPNVDGNDVLNNRSTIYFRDTDGHNTNLTEYTNLGSANTFWRGVFNPGPKTVDPNSGITTSELSSYMNLYWTGGSDTVDITDNPQIPDGFDGQEIFLIQIGASDKATQFDDGNGLDMMGDSTRTIALGESIWFMYSENRDEWIMQGANDQ